MKYEISEIINDKYNCGSIILRIHKKINKEVTDKMIIKFSFSSSFAIYLLFIIFNSMYTFILCNDFILNFNNSHHISKFLRILTPFFYVEKLNINNLAYLIICSIILIIFILKILYLSYFSYKVKKLYRKDAYNLKLPLVVIILNHFGFIFFSYIIEFFSFIVYIELFPNDFIIKKSDSMNKVANKIFIFINILFILIYNYYHYKIIELINIPDDNENYPFRMRFKTLKFYTLIIFENISLLESLPLCLNYNFLKIWYIIFDSSSCILLIIICVLSVKSYNYNNIINKILSFIGELCFSSLFVEIIIYISSLRYIDIRQFINFICIKILIAICLHYFLYKIYKKIMLKRVKNSLFITNTINYSSNKSIVNTLLYLKEIINNNNKVLSKIVKYLNKHQELCIKKYCGCKKLKLVAFNELDIIKNKKYYLQQIFFYIESILINLNFNNNLQYAFLLSDYFLSVKNNPILSYCILQTLLHNNYKTLSSKDLISIYGTLNKFIKYIYKDKLNRVNLNRFNNNKKDLALENKEYEVKKYFKLLIKINGAIKLMKNYSISFNEIIKYKQKYENSIQIQIDETDGEIKSINSELLTNSFIFQIIQILKKENIDTLNLKKIFYELKDYNMVLSYEFLFKSFLFIDYFWAGEIPNEFIDILFGNKLDKYLYTDKINQEIYDLLEKNYNKYFSNHDNKYFLLLKYTKGTIISYISETLIRKLQLLKKDIINQDLSILFINDLIIPHNNAINQFFMIKNNYLLKDKNFHFFNSKKYMIESINNSTFQIGLNKNILIISMVKLNEKSNQIIFLANKNFEIISINNNFEQQFHISLPLIEEFKLGIKDLFEINKNNIVKKYEKEFGRLDELRKYINLDPKETILRNIFKRKHIKENNLYMNEFDNMDIYDDNEEDDETNHFKKNLKNSFVNIMHKIYKNKIDNLSKIKPINFKINKDTINNKLKYVLEKISNYEQAKLEAKNIYQDYLLFMNNYNYLLLKNNIFFIINIQLIILYDTPFYLCSLDFYENNVLVKVEIDNKIHILNKNSIIQNLFYFKEDKLKHRETLETKKYFITENIDVHEGYKKNIKINKELNKLICYILLGLIFILIIIIITILFYQITIISENDRIFRALFYNYYQKAQLLYINSVLLSTEYNLVNLNNNISDFKEKQELLLFLCNNLQEGYHLFYSNYMEYKSNNGEDVGELYELKEVNQISINWKNNKVYNDYLNELQLLIYRVYECIKLKNITDEIIEDCENLILWKFQNEDKEPKEIETHGELIILIYYLIFNYDSTWNIFYEDLALSFEASFNTISYQKIKIYLVFEIIGIIIYIIIFIINYIYLIKSNKHIFYNILCLFIDFTQNNSYNFNNKIYNFFINNTIINYISLLNEFTLQKFEILKNEVFNYDIHDIDKKDFNITFTSDIKNLDNKIIILNKGSIRKKGRPKSLISNSSESNRDNNLKRSLSRNKSPKKNNEHNFVPKKGKKDSDLNIDNNHNFHLLNFSNLSHNINKRVNYDKDSSNNIFNNDLSREISNISSLNDNHQNNNSSILNLKYLNNSSFNKININDNNNSINAKNEKNINILESDSKLTIDKILSLSKISVIKMIKFIMIVFIIFGIIFIFYYIIKIILGFIIITKIGMLHHDFKILCSQYNEVVHYWKSIKTLIILPNITISLDLINAEIYFNKLNNEVFNLLSTRINNYKRIKALYSIIYEAKTSSDLLEADFCKSHDRCYDLLNSSKNTLLNGLHSAVSLYGKEIETYYRDYIKVKDIITTKEEIKKYLIKDSFSILSSNIDHIMSFMQEKFFQEFIKDENEIKSEFINEIKILNIVALCYCIALNLFTLLFVFSYVNNIIEYVESSAMRIILSLCHFKNKIKEKAFL